MRQEAGIAAVDVGKRLGPASQDSLRKWLLALGAVCAGASTEEAAGAWVNAMAGLLDTCSGALTKASLKRAATKFKYKPCFSELSQFFEEERAEIETKLKRLKAISNFVPRQMLTHEEFRKRDPESQAKVEAGFAAIKDAIARALASSDGVRA